tara:strand:- start:2987 stop:3727 length:741 start_codon:yes stop_codon:yes gene_type:complete
MNILVVGESCKDVYQYGDCVRLCPEAPVPVFKSSNDKKQSPGMAMNVWRNIVSMHRTAEVEIVTNDNWPTITKTRCVDNRTNYIIVRIDDNEDDYLRCDVKTIEYDKYDVIVISDYNKGYLTEDDINYIAKNHSVTFLDTKKILGEWCHNIKFIKINEFEYDRTKHKLTPELIEKMIITLGPKGARHRGVTFTVPEVEIKDTSGAGDTFIASLAANYALSRDIFKAIEGANASATKVVQKKGVSVV